MYISAKANYGVLVRANQRNQADQVPHVSQ